MSHPPTRHARFLLVLSLAASIAATSLAQEEGPRGLDALSDDRLLTELSRRNLKSLLDRAFQENKTPQSKRDAVLASGALSRLQGNDTAPLAERRKLVAEYVKALPQLLNQISDPQSLLADATVLIDHGILTDQQLLEYFGPNATIMTRLQPVA
ncbi:MAG: hypothetical protein H7144_09405, partial [Burkholderiales bacterium]|nr:hypothetical protein [Phycisphaerae bacterium]